MRSVGIDLHKNNFQVCYLTEKEKSFAFYPIFGL